MQAKEYVNKIIKRFPNYNEYKIINKIKSYSYVSFDVFDTLIKRYELKPTDLFKVTARKYNCLFGTNQIDEDEFARKRIAAEGVCRYMNEAEEITLDEIYDELRGDYGEICNELKNIEIQTEIAKCYPNPVLKNIFLWCKKNNKRIIITSDMYLPQKCIEEMLHSCGYYGYDNIFVSSENRVTKKSGRLFILIIKKLSIESRTIIHIGDNIISDYIAPRKLGIHSVKIATYPNRTIYFRARHLKKKDAKEYTDLKKYVSGFISTEWSGYFQFGFEVLGPLVYCFCKWLKKESNREISRLFFLSRDGYLLKNAYLEMFPEDEERVDYLYVSRKALRLPQVFVTNDIKTVMGTFRPNAYLNYKDICYGLCLAEDFGKKCWINAGLNENETILAKDFYKNYKGQIFYESVQEQIIHNSKIEYEKVIKYIKQKEFKGKVGIVDIGWAGTLQRCLQRMTKKNDASIEIYGYYLGMTADNPGDIKAQGYIPTIKEPYSLCVGVVECGFPAAEGSTNKYAIDSSGVVIPELLEYEYKNNSIEDAAVKDIQKGVLHFIKVMEMSSFCKCNLSSNAAYSNLEAFSKRPRMKDVKLLGNLEFHDQEVVPLAKPKKLRTYLLNPMLFKKDLNESTWKIGFLKRLFKIKLPYFRLMSIVKNI